MTKNCLIIFAATLLAIPSIFAQAPETGRALVLQASSDYETFSLRFETKGDMTAVKYCVAPQVGTTSGLTDCEEVGVFATEELAAAMEEDWMTSILGDTRQVGAGVTGAAIVGAITYMALNHLSKGLISKPASELLLKELLPLSGLLMANITAALTGAAVGTEAYRMTDMGQRDLLTDRLNQVAKSVRDNDGSINVEADSVGQVSSLLVILLGRMSQN